MLVIRFKVQCQPEKRELLRAAFAAVVPPSRQMAGVIHFDIAQDILDPNLFLATEVFTDRAALEQQESLPEVTRVMELLPTVLAADPEATVFNVSSSEPWGA